MRVLLYGRHRYPARRDDGTGLMPRPQPSGAPAAIIDILARGLAEEGHEVDYLLPAGLDEPLPDGVRHVAGPQTGADVLHNLHLDGRKWLVTVHGHRPPAVYFDRWVEGRAVADLAARDQQPQYVPVPNAIFVSQTLARAYGSTRFVRNGLDPHDYVFSQTKDDYLLFMAGMQGVALTDQYRGKGLDTALELSRELGFELRVAGTTRERELGEQIAALCRSWGATYLGDVRGPRKAELLAGARALLFPTRFNEGCPLVIIEALLSGTPVITSDRAGCAEMIDPAVGFVCSDREALRDAIRKVDSISPRTCRERGLRDYHYRRMASEYVGEYERELEGSGTAQLLAS
jgi:glycosyltransferase involved in cell wall biosynthesis